MAGDKTVGARAAASAACIPKAFGCNVAVTTPKDQGVAAPTSAAEGRMMQGQPWGSRGDTLVPAVIPAPGKAAAVNLGQEQLSRHAGTAPTASGLQSAPEQPCARPRAPSCPSHPREAAVGQLQGQQQSVTEGVLGSGLDEGAVLDARLAAEHSAAVLEAAWHCLSPQALDLPSGLLGYGMWTGDAGSEGQHAERARSAGGLAAVPEHGWQLAAQVPAQLYVSHLGSGARQLPAAGGGLQCGAATGGWPLLGPPIGHVTWRDVEGTAYGGSADPRALASAGHDLSAMAVDALPSGPGAPPGHVPLAHTPGPQGPPAPPLPWYRGLLFGHQAGSQVPAIEPSLPAAAGARLSLGGGKEGCVSHGGVVASLPGVQQVQSQEGGAMPGGRRSTAGADQQQPIEGSWQAAGKTGTLVIACVSLTGGNAPSPVS